MTKLQLLHRALNERLMAAVEQIMEMVGGTVLEYEEETIRARKENEVLRRRLRWMEGANPTDWPDDPDPSQQDECAVNFTFEQGSEALVIKTETTDHPLYNAAAVPQSVDQGADVAGTSTGISCGMGGGMTWDSAQSYMAPLDFDPTSGNTRVRHWRGRNRRQRMSFACPDCGKVFGREQRLMIHMRIHSNERPYKYRRRKAFFYGDNKKKRKLQALSQLSGEIVVDLSDCSEQTNRSSASPEQLAVTAEQKEGPGGLSTESDHSDKETENRTTTPACHQRKKKRGGNPVHCYCPHCPDRVFARPCQLAMHMKTHTVKALVNLPSQAQSGTDEKMDLNLKSQKRQRKNDAVKKAKDAGKSEFRCPKCDRVFAFECRLRFHMKSHKAKRSLLRKTLSPIQTEPAKEETMEPVPKTTDVQYLQEGPECQSNSTDDLFKIHHCCYCKQPHYRMMDHLQSVHPNEPEVAKALTFIKSSQERKHILNLLQTKGNVLHSTNVDQSSKEDLKPFGMFGLDNSFDDSVYCIYCLGLFNKKTFATHLELCKGKSLDSAEDDCVEILPNAGPVPSTLTLTSPWSLEEVDVNLEPSGFRCLNITYETEQLNLYNEQGSSSHQDVTFSLGQPDFSSPNEGVRNEWQTEGANLQLKHSPENEVSYDFKSDNSTNPSPGQESTDCKYEEISLPLCDVDQERTMMATSDTCSIKVHPENDILKNPCDYFSQPHSSQTVSKDRVKAQTCGSGRKRKRRSRVKNESLIMNYDVLGEGERPSSKVHVCQHCGATLSSSYTLRRHEYTHTGDVSTNPNQEKLKRPKRRIQGRQTSVKDEASLELSANTPKDLPDGVNDDNEEKVAATKQDTEERGFHWEEAGHSKVKD